MRTLPLLAFLAACSASGPSGPTPAADASADAPPPGDTGFQCVLGREVRVAGACVPFGDANCGAIGRACPTNQQCTVADNGDGGTALVCLPRS